MNTTLSLFEMFLIFIIGILSGGMYMNIYEYLKTAIQLNKLRIDEIVKSKE